MQYSPFYVFLLLFITSCTTKKEISEQDPQRLRSEIPATEVHTVQAKIAPFEYLIQASGKIQSQTDIEIKSMAGGIIETLNVKNGALVKKGDLLARLDNTRQSLAMDKAKLQWQEREITFQDQLLSYAGADTVKYARARNNMRLTSGFAAAEIAYREAKLEFDHTFIRATASGTISNLDLRPGNTVTTGQLFCSIHDAGKLVAVCEVLEADALKLKTGTRAVMSTLSANEAFITGSVLEINPRVDEKSNMVRVRLIIETSKALMPGMTVQVTIKVPYQKNIIIPKEAVVVRSGRHVVFTEENGVAKWNYVTIGQENGKEVEILDGLKNEQHVIITNNLQLAHDAPVNRVN